MRPFFSSVAAIMFVMALGSAARGLSELVFPFFFIGCLATLFWSASKRRGGGLK